MVLLFISDFPEQPSHLQRPEFCSRQRWHRNRNLQLPFEYFWSTERTPAVEQDQISELWLARHRRCHPMGSWQYRCIRRRPGSNLLVRPKCWKYGCGCLFIPTSKWYSNQRLIPFLLLCLHKRDTDKISSGTIQMSGTWARMTEKWRADSDMAHWLPFSLIQGDSPGGLANATYEGDIWNGLAASLNCGSSKSKEKYSGVLTWFSLNTYPVRSWWCTALLHERSSIPNLGGYCHEVRCYCIQALHRWCFEFLV